jgi:hypothetical protein
MPWVEQKNVRLFVSIQYALKIGKGFIRYKLGSFFLQNLSQQKFR